MTVACGYFPRVSGVGGYNAPRTNRASMGGRCSIGILGFRKRSTISTGFTSHKGSATYLDPSAVLKSTVLVGAMTKNGILCLAASTAALYVPIYPCQIQQAVTEVLESPPHLVGGVTVLGDPICTNN